jgi:demethylspheroidene O-methyltransferase
MIEGQGKSIGCRGESPQGWRVRLLGWRNRVIGSQRFQKWAAATPFVRSIARRRAVQLFDLVAGFSYSQVLLATVESGCVQRLAQGPATTAELAEIAGLSEDACVRLMRAATALGITQEVGPKGKAACWMLGRHGAALHGNAGALAMIRHHRLLYADLADPLALLRADRAEPTGLQRFWTYAGQGGDDLGGGSADPYSHLMSASQAAVSHEILAAYNFARHDSLLDVGGGHGTFLTAVGEAAPRLRLGLFDLPEVVEGAPESLGAVRHPGSFLTGDIPGGYDCITLVRILHDHDDEPALHILGNIRAALAPGKTLLIGEPLAETPGAEPMGGAYFGMYLWAMGSGRPRTAHEIRAMLTEAGFSASRRVSTRQPLIASVIVAHA